MPFDATAANTKTAEINDAFAAIGTATIAAMPPSQRNNEPQAWEYHVASHLLRIAEARKTAAARSAVKAGILFDHEKRPCSAGTNALVYAGDVVEIRVAVTTPASRLDAVAFVADLEERGVSRELLDKLLTAHTKQNRAPHKFTSSLLTSA